MTTENLTANEESRHGWYGIPDPKKRAAMSPEDLAIELSKIEEKDSPPYILLSHELNLRLAKEQSKATLEVGRRYCSSSFRHHDPISWLLVRVITAQRVCQGEFLSSYHM